MNFLSLEAFINTLTANSNIHICFDDTSGIFANAFLRPNVVRMIHSSEFCTKAKTLKGGLNRCLLCRKLTEKKIYQTKKPFAGTCIFGLTEIVYPVFRGSELLCVLYLGNLTDDTKLLAKKVKKICEQLQVSPDSILAAIPTVQSCNNIHFYYQLAEAIASYICLLSTQECPKSSENYHPAVLSTINYIQHSFHRNIHLDYIACNHNLNTKYLGRLFFNQTGQSVRNYLNYVRIRHAKQLLSETNAQIIEIALDCGFNNVTYFNRIFKSFEKITPGEYRKIKKDALY